MMSSLETILFNTFTELHGHSRTRWLCNCRSNQFFNLKIMFSHINLRIMILLIYTFLKAHLILKQRRQILPLGHRQLAMFVMSALMLCSRATMPAFHNGVEIFFDFPFTISFIFIFFTDVTHSWASAGTNCIIWRLCHSPIQYTIMTRI